VNAAISGVRSSSVDQRKSRIVTGTPFSFTFAEVAVRTISFAAAAAVGAGDTGVAGFGACAWSDAANANAPRRLYEVFIDAFNEFLPNVRLDSVEYHGSTAGRRIIARPRGPFCSSLIPLT
jgi:hypothetical protein